MKAWAALLLSILMLPLLASGAPTGSTIAVGALANQNGRNGSGTDDGIQYVSPNGSDGNDGLSWATAKANIATAETSLPSCSFGNHCGTVYVGPGNYTLTSELDIGDSSGSPIVVKLVGPMTVNMQVSGSSSCSIEQWKNTVIDGAAKGGGSVAGRIMFQSVAGFSPYAFYCTAGAVGGKGGYYRASGFMIRNSAGVTTTSGYAAVFAKIFDASRFSEMNITDWTNNVAWVWNACCGTTFLNDVLGGNYRGGVVLTVGPGLDANGTFEDMDLNFIGMSLGHNSPSSSMIVIQEPKNNGGNLNFYGTYVEGSTTAHTVPFIDIKAAQYGVYFRGLQIEGVTPETVYAVRIERGAGVRGSISGMFFEGDGDKNAIQNDLNGETVTIRPLRGYIPDYVFANGGSGVMAHLGSDSITSGTITLSSGSGSSTFFRPYANSPVCTATDATSASPVQVTSSPTSITVTVAGRTGTGPGTGSDVVEWICVPKAK